MKSTKQQILISILIAPLVILASPYDYIGEFQSIVSSGSPCDTIFSEGKFQAQHFITGPTHLTSVINFKNQENKGFFNKINLIGNNDGWGQMRVEREVVKEGATYKILADGMYDQGFLILDITIEAFKDLKQPAVCKASSQFSAFR